MFAENFNFFSQGPVLRSGSFFTICKIFGRMPGFEKFAKFYLCLMDVVTRGCTSLYSKIDNPFDCLISMSPASHFRVLYFYYYFCLQQTCGPRVERRVPAEVHPGPQAAHVQEPAVLQDRPLPLRRLYPGR